MTDQPTRVLLITGYSRSGSTLLARVLGAVDGLVAPGELRYLWRRGLAENRRCDCGEPFLDCPFWIKVLARAFGGVERSDVEDALREQSLVDRTHRIPSLATGRARLQADTSSHLRRYERLYQAIEEVADARVIVDSSKDPSFGHLLTLSSALELSVVHLVRDSRAVAFSWTRHKYDPGTGRDMARQRPLRSALEWDTANFGAAWLTRRVRSSLRLRYEDLMAAPADSIRRVLDLVGGGDPSSIVDQDRVTLEPGHGVSGNPLRFQKGVIPIREDTAWREAMSWWDRLLVSTISWPGLTAFGYSIRSRP